MGSFKTSCLLIGWMRFVFFIVKVLSATADLKIITHPEDLKVSLGGSINLKCTFNEPVNCMWHRNDQPLDIVGRYRYVSQDEKNTDDCSINIEQAKGLDFGTWQCENKVDKGETPRKSRIAKVSLSVPDEKLSTRDSAINDPIMDSGPADPLIIVEFDNENANLQCRSTDTQDANFMWEFCPTGTLDWVIERGSLISTVNKYGYFKCSATINGKTFYSTQYRKTDSNHGQSKIVLTVMGVIIGILVGILSAIIFFVCRPEAIKTISKCCGFTSQTTDEKRERQGFLRSTIAEEDGVELTPMLGKNDNSVEPLPIESETDVHLTHHPKEINEIEHMKQDKIDQKQIAPGVFVWIIYNYTEKKENENGGCLRSDNFDVFGYKMLLNVHLTGFTTRRYNYVSLGLEFAPENSSHSMHNIFYHSRTFFLLDQNTDGKALRHVVRHYEPRFKGENLARKWMENPFGPQRFADHSLIENENRGYLKEDAIIIKIVIEPLTQILNRGIPVISQNQSVMWKIDNFLKRQQDEKSGIISCLSSESFYTFNNGYRMKVVLYSNGFGEGKNGYISIFFAFFMGQESFDSYLADPYHYKIEITLKGQNGKKDKSRTEILNPNDIGAIEGRRRMKEFRGFAKFVMQREIKKGGQYLDKDDAMYVQINVTSLDDKDKEKSTKANESLPTDDLLSEIVVDQNNV